MLYQWDEKKRLLNLSQHGVDFAVADGFDWGAALVKEDTRQNYGERRYTAVAPIEERVHVMVFTVRGTSLRIISLRKANRREVEAYDEAT